VYSDYASQYCTTVSVTFAVKCIYTVRYIGDVMLYDSNVLLLCIEPYSALSILYCTVGNHRAHDCTKKHHTVQYCTEWLLFRTIQFRGDPRRTCSRSHPLPFVGGSGTRLHCSTAHPRHRT